MTNRDLDSARKVFHDLGPDHEIAMLIGMALVREVERFEAFRRNLQALLDADAAGIPSGGERIPSHVRKQLEALLRWEAPEECESEP